MYPSGDTSRTATGIPVGVIRPRGVDDSTVVVVSAIVDVVVVTTVVVVITDDEDGAVCPTGNEVHAARSTAESARKRRFTMSRLGRMLGVCSDP